jgi:WD40 repeat protein
MSADGARVVTGAEDELAKVWDAATGACLCTFKSHADRIIDHILGIATSADGLRVAIAIDTRDLKVWDAPRLSRHARFAMALHPQLGTGELDAEVVKLIGEQVAALCWARE